MYDLQCLPQVYKWLHIATRADTTYQRRPHCNVALIGEAGQQHSRHSGGYCTLPEMVV